MQTEVHASRLVVRAVPPLLVREVVGRRAQAEVSPQGGLHENALIGRQAKEEARGRGGQKARGRQKHAGGQAA